MTIASYGETSSPRRANPPIIFRNCRPEPESIKNQGLDGQEEELEARRRILGAPHGVHGGWRSGRCQPAPGGGFVHRRGRERCDGARRHRRSGAARRLGAPPRARGRDQPGGRPDRGRGGDDRRRHPDVHQLQPACERGRSDGRDGQPAAHAEAELGRRAASLSYVGRGRGHRDCRAGLPADLGLRDGALAAGENREGDSARAHDQAGGSTDAVQDVAHPERGREDRRRSRMSGFSAGSGACSCWRSCSPGPPGR